MFKTCLLAVDLTDGSVPKRLVDTAVSLAGQGAALHVLNVVPDSGMAIVDQMLGPNHGTRMMDEATAQLRDWAAKTLPDGTQVHVARGTIYDQILRTARKLEADVICVGAHRPALQDYLVGPNAARVVRHATQSVMVIR